MTNIKTIGIITPFIDGQYFGGLLFHIHRIAQSRGIRVLAITTLQDNSNFESPLATAMVDAWIVIKHPLNASLLQDLQNSGKKIVGIGHRSSEYPCVEVDNMQAMQLSTEHLIRHGHRKIAFVGNLRNATFRQRFEGYKSALEQNHLPFDPNMVIEVSNSAILGGIEAADRFLQIRQQCSAVVTCSDYVAMLMIDQLESCGIQVPQEAAIIGFDDSPRAAEYQLPLTTVLYPVEQVACEAIRLLLDELDATFASTKHILLKASLRIRESCGCLTGRTKSVPKSTGDYLKLMDSLENSLEVSRQIANLLATGNFEQIENLTWLNYIRTKWACFAKWSELHPAGSHLTVSAVISETGSAQENDNECYPLQNYPVLDKIPAETLEDGQNIVVLFPIRSANRDWGILSWVLTIDEKITYFKANTSTYPFALLGQALEQQELFNENRRITRVLETVSTLTSDGIWEMDLLTDQMEWSTRLSGIPLGNDLDSFLECMHPDDRNDLAHCFLHLPQISQLQKEVRLRSSDNELIWVDLLAKVITDAEGASVRMVGSIRDISERKRSEEQISYLAYHDTLTGLPNRAFFWNRLQETFSHARQEKSMFAVLLIDLDRFKMINDNYSHKVGDLVLTQMATQLQSISGKDQMVSRHGGDEFLMLIPHIMGEEQVHSVCDQILNLFKMPLNYKGQEIFVTGSVGYSIYPDDGEDLDTLVNNADMAMYQAKFEGRNRFKSYKSESNVLRGVSKIVNYLHKASTNQEFELYYQPQIDIQSGRIIGMESLIRWNSPELGIVLPGDFIPVAEETGLIVPIGKWVLQEACRQNRKWQLSGYPPFPISVNLSILQLKDMNFLEQVQTILKETKLPPRYLCLEITESTAVQDIDMCRKRLQELISLGVQISLDDFGTGFSSLFVLNSLPFHTVKIDKSFVKHLQKGTENSAKKLAIVKSIISMAHELELKTLAEGVEQDAQLSLLKQNGCDSYQGYLYSKPLTVEEMEARMNDVMA